MSYLRRIGINCFNVLRDIFVAAAERGMKEELARRDGERGGHNLRWFTPEEASVAEALARIIVPSDEETPGLDDVGVLDLPAIIALDNLVIGSQYRQQLYSRGLLAFDNWALSQHGCKFAEVRKEDQIKFFSAVQQVSENKTDGIDLITRAWRKLRITQPTSALHAAAQLYPHIRTDCIQVFYTSRVSWVWLEYDGPPMDKGYPSLTEQR